MNLSDLPRELVERGIWWQIAGFAVVSAVSTVVLVEFEGSESRAYRYHETAVRALYWANAFVLIGVFEGVRRMFEKASTLRAQYRERAERRWLARQVKRSQKRRKEAYDRYGVDVDGVRMLPDTPEVRRFLDGEGD